MNRGRVLAAILIAAALVFAFAAGEYGTLDWFELRREERDERLRITELQHVVDSLQKVAAGLEKDPRTQERVAREEFGMIRKGEHVYRLVPADSDPPGR
ncbi:MAG TPA: septum formation initiator family protein [Gemmatimonadales bacterium]|nr:septum formation initiator family protein [Gemmatimonadales bacterium]